ncbi:hypothetical protein INR49_021985 [Caranx melampygus]|nr:hypothetical protein INR49_021985 [Caranx melampygus]
MGTLRQAGAVVPGQSVPGRTETDEGTIWELSAEMLTSSVSIATAVGARGGVTTDQLLRHVEDLLGLLIGTLLLQTLALQVSLLQLLQQEVGPTAAMQENTGLSPQRTTTTWMKVNKKASRRSGSVR